MRDFESKLNQLKLVEMGTKVSKEIDSRFDPQFLDDQPDVPLRPAKPASVPQLLTFTD